MPFLRSKTAHIAVIVLRVALGCGFVYSGYVKLSEPWQLFAANIAAYEVVPMWVAKFVAHTLPWFELLLGLLLIAGRWLRTVTVVTSGLLLFFVGMMLVAKLGGKDIACGCFSSDEPISWKTFLRDGSMLADALFLAVIAFRFRRTTA